MTDPRKLAEEVLVHETPDAWTGCELARELLAALDREAALLESEDELATELATARTEADALEGALRHYAARDQSVDGGYVAREALAAHGKKP